MKTVHKKDIKKTQRIGLIGRIAILDQVDNEGFINMKVTPEYKPEGSRRNKFKV